MSLLLRYIKNSYLPVNNIYKNIIFSPKKAIFTAIYVIVFILLIIMTKQYTSYCVQVEAEANKGGSQ